MRRLVALAVVAGLVIIAVALPEPEAPSAPQFTAPIESGIGGSVSGVWYCPTTQATLERETHMPVVSIEAGTAAFTFPNPVPGEDADQSLVSLAGFGATTVQVSDIALRGDAPSFVEFSTPQTAAFALTRGDALEAGDTCIASVPKIWYLAGASTVEDREATLRLFNPFPEIAKVTITAASELGVEPLAELEAFSVPARSWRDLTFGDSTGELRLRESLAFTIVGDEGLVLPSLIVADDADEAHWPGTGLARDWEFPVVGLAGQVPTIVVYNPGDTDVEVEVDIITPEETQTAALTAVVSAGTPLVIPLEELAGGAFGVRLRAAGRVAATAVAGGGGGLAGTVGATTPATRWVMPGAPAEEAGGVAALWLLNSGMEPSTVTLQPVGSDTASAEKVLVQAGTLRQVIIDVDADAILIEGTSPVTAAWSVQSDAGIAFVGGIALAG